MRDILLMLVIAAESHSQSQQGGGEEAFLRLLLFCRRLCRFFAGCYEVSSSPQERPDPLEDVRAACTVRLRNWRANAATAAAAGAADDDFRVEV